MKKRSLAKRAAALALALVTALGLMAGCGDNSTTGTQNTDTPEFVYVASYATIGTEGQFDSISNCCYADGQLYFTAQIVDGEETYTDSSSGESYTYDTYRTGLFTCAEDGTNVQEMTAYQGPQVPDGMEGDANINAMAPDPQGALWVFESLNTYSYDLPDNFDPATMSKWDYYVDGGQSYYLRKLDSTGAELVNVDLSVITGQQAEVSGGSTSGSDISPYSGSYFYLSGFTVDGSGNLYLNDSDGNIYVLDSTGASLFTLAADDQAGWVNSMTRLADGSVAVSIYDSDNGGLLIKPIDVAAKAYGEGVSAPSDAWTLYPGAGDYDFYYNGSTSFFGFSMKTGESTKLLTWINSDVDDSNISSILPLADGRIVCCSTEYDDTTSKSTTELISMVKTPSSQVEQKTTLTFACMYLDWNLRSQIIKFNKTNDKYRIEVQDYSEYNTEDDYDAGLTKLSTEIIAGNVPDLLDTSGLPIEHYAAKGLLEDLWPYIDADTELGGRDGLITPVFDAMSTDGKLYQITPDFSVFTAAGAPALVGDTPGWTLDDLYTALGQLQDGAEVFSQGTVKSDVLSYSCAMGLDDFVNWQTGECSFDSDEFIDILKFTDLFPAEFDWDNFNYDEDYESDYSRISSGRQLLTTIYASDFRSLQMYEEMFGGSLTFIGFPTRDDSNGSAFQISDGLAMSSTCTDKDAAWTFMRTLLTQDYQESNTWQFPTNKAAFDAQLEEAMTPQYTTDPETGAQVEQSQGSWGWGDLNVDIYAMTQAEADQIMDLINGTTKVYGSDQEIMDIITDSTADFFSGQRTAEDTAAAIQSRVSLYVNEQK